MQVRYQAALRPEGRHYIRAESEPRRESCSVPAKQLANRSERCAQFLGDQRCAGTVAIATVPADWPIALVEAVPRPADREALLVKQFPNSPDQQNFVMLVVAPV